MVGEPRVGEVVSSAPSTVTGSQLGNPRVSVLSAGNLQLGSLLLSLGMLPQQAVPQQSTISPATLALHPPCYTYLVSFVNSKKRSYFTLRNWYDVNEKFTSIASLKLRLMDTFPT